MKNIRLILVLTVLVLSAAGAPASSDPTRSSGLQGLIDGAADGDTIVVDGGIHEGDITIHRKLVLLGRNAPVIRGGGGGSCVTISADSCTLSGFVIERSGGDLMRDHAGIMVKSSHNLIEGNTLRDILFGVYLYHAHFNRIVGNSITGRSELGLGQRGSGVHIFDSYYNTLTDNVITQARDGFYIEYANHTFIARNEVSDLRYGLHYMYADSNTFLANTFHHNVAGAAIMYSRNIRFRHNVFAHNRGFTSYGILFQDCHDMLADSNVIVDNVVGMFFEATTDNVFRDNVIAQNDVALKMFQNSSRNTFTGNNFIDNLSPLSLVGRETGTRWHDGGRGNYWSSYGGYDLDGDGTGDIPMKIQNVFQYLEGQNANVRLYLYSPASQALAASAEAFPILDVSRESDPAPLMTPADLGNMPAVTKMKDIQGGGADAGHLLLALPLVGISGIAFVYHRLARKGGR